MREDIGKISAGWRFIDKGEGYEKMFERAENKSKIALWNVDVHDTVRLMGEIVRKTKVQTAKLARFLKGRNLQDTCNNVWEFLYNHIQYEYDKAGVEQLRLPLRSWNDRKRGIDCDCFSIFVSSILTNLDIKHAFRITKYDKDTFQHVYVIVPIPNIQDKYYTIDCVLSQFDYEKPYTEKKDFIMRENNLNGINVEVLSGFEQHSDRAYFDVIQGTHFDGVALGAISEEEAVYQHLISTRQVVSEKPYLISSVDDPQAFLQMLDYAIAHWNSPQRDLALSVLAKNEDAINAVNGFFSGDDDLAGEEDELGELDGEDDLEGLGKPKAKKMFKQAKKQVKKQNRQAKKVAKKANKLAKKTAKKQTKVAKLNNETAKIVANTPQTTAVLPPKQEVFQESADEYFSDEEPIEDAPTAETQSEDFGEEGEDLEGFLGKAKKGVLKNAVKKAAKGVVRFNPVTISARSGLLLALKMNFKKIASKVKWGYATKEQALKKGISEAKWSGAKKSLADMESTFEKMGGKKDNLKKAILKGKAGGLNGELGTLEGLGEPISMSTITAAIPVIVKIVQNLKKNGIMSEAEASDAEKELNNPVSVNIPINSGGNDNNKIPKWVVPTAIVAGLVLTGGIILMNKKKKELKKSANGLSGTVSKRVAKPLVIKRINLK